jgi:hypothetical protein
MLPFVLKLDGRAVGRPQLSATGNVVAIRTQRGRESFITIFELGKSRPIGKLVEPPGMAGFCLSKDGRGFIAWGDGAMRLFRMGAVPYDLKVAKMGRPRAVALSPSDGLLAIHDGTTLALVPVVREALRRRRRMAAPRPLVLKGAPGGAGVAVQFSRNGRHVAAWSPEGVAVWEAYSGLRVGGGFKPSGSITSIGFSPDGVVALSHTGNALRLWDATSGRLQSSV